MFRKSPFGNLSRFYSCLRSYADFERSDPFEPILVDCDLVPGDVVLDNLDEEVEARKKLSKDKQQVTEVDPNFSVQITNSVQNFGQSCRKVSTCRIQAKKAIRVVHCLGRCYMLFGIDYLSFSCACLQFPASEEYKHCASGVRELQIRRRTGTNISSSSNE